jgi:hypothetical protein
MARLQRLGRAHSHEGVTGGYYHTDPEEDGKTLCSSVFHKHILFTAFLYLNTVMLGREFAVSLAVALANLNVGKLILVLHKI